MSNRKKKSVISDISRGLKTHITVERSSRLRASSASLHVARNDLVMSGENMRLAVFVTLADIFHNRIIVVQC